MSEPRRRPWHRVLRAVMCSSLGLVLTLSCKEPDDGPSAGSNSNWLVGCDDDASCSGETACQCGACTLVCRTDTDCAALPGARCAARVDGSIGGLVAQCGQQTYAGVCQPACSPGECGAGAACVFGGCVLDAVPDVELCAPFQSPTAADRGEADRLLELVETLRLQGGVSCAGSAPTDPGQALRLDARLTCAARAFADDLRVTRMQVLTDSLGRDTQARLALAGYEAQFWAEGLALAAVDPSDALSMMLSSPSACRGLTHPDARDVGVARVGDVFVVTLGAE